jgi:hypothetical protein
MSSHFKTSNAERFGRVVSEVNEPQLTVSVIINNHNNGAYLGECIESVLQQTRRPDEIILFDDGSTDESLEVMARYQGRITVIVAEHGRDGVLKNQARAIDAAFRKSTGQVVFLLDGDDVFIRQKIAAYMDVFESDRTVVMVQAPLEKIDRSGVHLGFEYEAPRHQADYRQHIYVHNELNVYYPTSSLAFTRAYLEQRLPLDFSDGLPVWSDARLALCASLFGSVVTLEIPYTQWRRHPCSHSVTDPMSIYEMVKANQAFFNSIAAAVGQPRLVPWKSWQHWLRTARHYVWMDSWMKGYRTVRWAVMGPKKREELRSAGPKAVWMRQQMDLLKAEILGAHGTQHKNAGVIGSAALDPKDTPNSA